jgi:hypothetical protein
LDRLQLSHQFQLGTSMPYCQPGGVHFITWSGRDA